MKIYPVLLAISGLGGVPQSVLYLKFAVRKVFHLSQVFIKIENGKNSRIGNMPIVQQPANDLSRTAGNNMDFIPAADGFGRKSAEKIGIVGNDAMKIQAYFCLLYTSDAADE